MGDPNEPVEESIGRPGPWGEDRYGIPGQPEDQSVLPPPGTSPRSDEPKSTPVTRKDYEFPDEQTGPPEGEPPPGGDTG
jgi:hypothetical protein